MVLPLHKITRSAQETKKLGALVGAYLLTRPAGESGTRRVVCLYGELGSGKTTFVQGLAASFGITKRLPSPTFVIVRHYNIPSTKRELYHIDLYRLQNEQDMVGAGIPEILGNADAFVCIEWPERLESLLPRKRLDVQCVARVDGAHVFSIKRI